MSRVIITPVPCSPVRAGASEADDYHHSRSLCNPTGNRVVMCVDGEGYAIQRFYLLHPDAPGDFGRMIAHARFAYPLPEIVMPAGWPTDADGRGYTVLEVERGQTKQQRMQDLRTSTENAA
jgi:hypothetical protein